jgi:hypothetical protein
MIVTNESLKINSITLLDKVKALLEQPYKLVLVQQHELERLRSKENRSQYSDYIERLYTHYIVKKLGKTYLQL